jgi:hypothetical protein
VSEIFSSISRRSPKLSDFSIVSTDFSLGEAMECSYYQPRWKKLELDGDNWSHPSVFHGKFTPVSSLATGFLAPDLPGNQFR